MVAVIPICSEVAANPAGDASLGIASLGSGITWKVQTGMNGFLNVSFLA